MKIERILRLTVLFIIAVLVVASCDDDGYSLSKFSISYGVIHKSAEDSYTVKLDNGFCYISVLLRCSDPKFTGQHAFIG